MYAHGTGVWVVQERLSGNKVFAFRTLDEVLERKYSWFEHVGDGLWARCVILVESLRQAIAFTAQCYVFPAQATQRACHMVRYTWKPAHVSGEGAAALQHPPEPAAVGTQPRILLAVLW